MRSDAIIPKGSIHGGVAALLWGGRVSDWSASLAALGVVQDLHFIALAMPDPKDSSAIPPGVECDIRQARSLSAAVADAFATGVDHVLLLTAPVIVPSGILDYAAQWASDDPRIGVVSFLTNAAGYLSFPLRNARSSQNVSGDTADSLTRKIRSALTHPGRSHIAIPEGKAVLLGRGAFSAIGGLNSEFDDDAELSIAEFALRASRRGFFVCLDPLTFVVCPLDLEDSRIAVGLDPERRDRLHSIHPFFPALYDRQRESGDGPLALTLDYVRAGYNGLRVLIDASCLGPHEMGTQVQTVSLIEALANHPRVQWVGVSLPGPTVPNYAKRLMNCSKVRLYPSGGLTFSGAETADILHRPFQPDSEMPLNRWREMAKRVVVTIQDLIAYRIGAYHDSPESWLKYRDNLCETLRQIDGTITITQDVRQSISQEKLEVPVERVFVVENGTDHLEGNLPEQIPFAIAERGWSAASFLLVLGTDYTHKNRDLAIRIWQTLRQRGHSLRLVLAGATVPYGANRHQEALAGIVNDDILVLPDVSSSERNWILRHASCVLYPTSAEGFGLVPFEAAQLGTPTVNVSFGPLREVAQGETSMPKSWDLDALADVAEDLLLNPRHVSAVVSALLRSGSALTWSHTADKLVNAYFELLARDTRR